MLTRFILNNNEREVWRQVEAPVFTQWRSQVVSGVQVSLCDKVDLRLFTQISQQVRDQVEQHIKEPL